ncbi:MAG: heavy metal sensor histidine kinase [Gemmatimonadales bacterium]|nr:heavy metal sensor histidine kinase [Gemmatimonadales bacterium]
MTRWWSSRSIRLRMTVWYGGTLLLLLLLYSVVVTAIIWRSLSGTLDRRLHSDFEIAETMLERADDGQIRWLGPLHPHQGDELDHQIWAEAWSPEGTLLFRAELPDWLAEAMPDATPDSDLEIIGRLTLPDNVRVRFLQGPFTVGGEPILLRVTRSEDSLLRTMRILILIQLLALPLTAALAGLAGYTLAQQLLDPVTRMTERARAITAERLDERLPVHNPDDELGNLAEVFNQTFARLERSFERLRQFTSDASHELRTPLTSIRSVGEVVLREPRDPTAYRDAIGSMLEEVDRVARLTDTLLTLSRADDGRVTLRQRDLDLSEFARDVVEELSLLAEERGQSLVLEAPGPVHVSADRDVLHHALGNLVDNAVKYSPEGTAIRVAVGQTADSAVVEVIDQGLGIPQAHQDHIFQRFYRVDRSRSRLDGGSGLGLAIVQWAVEAHGGQVKVESTEGKGSIFRIHLPNGTGA